MSVSVTLPGAQVTRTVSWDDVRRYLVVAGWSKRLRAGIETLWTVDSTAVDLQHVPARRRCWVGGEESNIAAVVRRIAVHEGRSPGEVLADLAPSAPIV